MQNKYKFYKRMKTIEKFCIDKLFKINVTGLENIPITPYILAGNHTSMLDIPLLMVSIDDQINFMAKAELFKNPILKWVLINAKAFPVEREKVDIKAMKNACNVIKSGEVLGIFPEGTRNKGHELLEFKKGCGIIAMRTNTVIVPFGISGTYKIGHQINLNIGEPIEALDAKENPNLLRDKVKTLIKQEEKWYIYYA